MAHHSNIAPRFFGRPWLVVLSGVVIFALIVVFSVVVQAGTSAGATTNTIRLCANKSSGVVAQRSSCKSSERTLTVNQVGIQGPRGLQGEPGAPGAQGEPGARGETGATGPAQLPSLARGNGVGYSAHVALTTGAPGVVLGAWEIPTDSPLHLVTFQFYASVMNNPNPIYVSCGVSGYPQYVNFVVPPKPSGMHTAGAQLTLFATSGETQIAPSCYQIDTQVDDPEVTVYSAPVSIIPIGTYTSVNLVD